MKISLKLRWVKEYIDLAQTMIPNLNKLVEVRVLPCYKKKITRHYGFNLRREDGLYVISIGLASMKVDSLKPRPKLKLNRYSKIEILGILAHELSHMKYFPHCPRRQILESQLMIVFMVRLSDSGYISEEDERAKRRRKSN